MIFDVTAFNALSLSQKAQTNIKGLTVSHTLSLSQRVDKNLKPWRAASTLRLSHLVTVGKTLSLSTHDNLILTQKTHPRSTEIKVNQLLFMWQNPVKEKLAPLATSQLVLTHSAVATVAKGAYNTLTLTHSVTVVKKLNIKVDQTLTLFSHTVGYLPDKYWSSYDINVVET